VTRYPLEFDDHRFATRLALARHLYTLSGRSVGACVQALRSRDDDPRAVLARYNGTFARIGEHTYRTRSDFIRYISHYFGSPESTVSDWLRRGRSPDEVIALARKRRGPAQVANKGGPVTIFGWRFHSFTALCNYYRVGAVAPPSWRESWREHRAAGRNPAVLPPLLKEIARLWQSGLLDEHNRFSPEREARMPRRWLPRNSEPEEVVHELERKLVDALQPPEAETLRRASLRELEQRRKTEDLPPMIGNSEPTGEHPRHLSVGGLAYATKPPERAVP
jgi:hypothetical protein